jgi:hypothetical protein|tara:strand:+ start:56 stop:169 length:114 start_codon:yes stop_codon:yes gene_type:complete
LSLVVAVVELDKVVVEVQVDIVHLVLVLVHYKEQQLV